MQPFRLFHLALGIVHLATSVLQFSIPTKYRAIVTAWSMYGPQKAYINDTVINGTISFIDNNNNTLISGNSSSSSISPVYYTHSVTVVNSDLNLVYFCAVFLLLAALDHFWTVFVKYEAYADTIKFDKHSVPRTSRWVEYSISAALMNVLIASMSGVQDVMMLIVVACLTAVMMTAGYMCEDGSNSVYPVFIGWSTFTLIWSIIFESFSGFADKAPDFVKAIMATLFVCEFLFGVVPVWTHRNIAQREYAYACLSLISKQLLAWITFAGLVNRDRDAV